MPIITHFRDSARNAIASLRMRLGLRTRLRRALKPLEIPLKRTLEWLLLVRWRLSHRRWGYPLPVGGYVNEDELRLQFRNALGYLQQKLGPEGIGDYIEFGVYGGSSLLLMYDELLRAELSHVRLFGFDSFAGLPSDSDGHWQEGAFYADYDRVVQSLNRRNVDWRRVTLIKGFFADTLTSALIAKHNLRQASLIMMDCDLYSSAKEALEFCGPLIRSEAIIFFDDWNPLARENKGEKRAFDEFLQATPDLEAEAIGDYSWQPGDLHGKVFRVYRASS
ncbi:class I SAM-dependent methyltransferase [Romeria aff. gracilis LEGE 07310]|uniref:Class I SAM-dependent methyltransferase n=1 Tax=Vasconcelosia minhoensis LEGE 07310 TaxID=915328 RepID=A0A8J7DLX2_9CYAN|nr:TylF/MycF/NovP-related O-methyltransferase [Romeria gracilis]MBE9077886.1 class I SAM-dependent methyltransferase [Romeria aff. gracilis LEGE 07310]